MHSKSIACLFFSFCALHEVNAAVIPSIYKRHDCMNSTEATSAAAIAATPVSTGSTITAAQAIPSVTSATVIQLTTSAYTTATAPGPLSTTNIAEFVTAEQLTEISTDMGTCDPDFPDECRNATQAAPFINKAFADYNITSVGEQAALLSLMLFESGGFKYDRNHFPSPGNPGQGTRNLMSFEFVREYALNTTSTSANVTSLLANTTDADISDETKNEVLSWVLPDELSFASAMWFYAVAGDAPCRQNTTIADGLQAATKEGWESFITGCVFTTVTEDRESVWSKTLEVLSANECEE